jgi:hypothetical protein
MKTMLDVRIAGSSERRPNANRMRGGSGDNE